jgi:hypothetical protein
MTRESFALLFHGDSLLMLSDIGSCSVSEIRREPPGACIATPKTVPAHFINEELHTDSKKERTLTG